MIHTRRFLALALTSVALLATPALTGCGGDDSSSSSGDATTGAGGSGAGGGGSGGGSSDGHLLFAEIFLNPEAEEFVEIWNPTSAPIDLTDYYISDNSVYYKIAAGEPWTPSGSTGSDFLARFPAGTFIPPDGLLTLAGGDGFEAAYGRCADLSLTTLPVPCIGSGGSVPLMDAPDNGALAFDPGILTNTGEMLILFTWSGTVGDLVKDVDYMLWGDMNLGDSEIVDKSAVMGYSPDTPPIVQRRIPAPGSKVSLQRCALEDGETTTGGNGLTGHDETSEPLDEHFEVQQAPDPGVKNACLMNL